MGPDRGVAGNGRVARFRYPELFEVCLSVGRGCYRASSTVDEDKRFRLKSRFNKENKDNAKVLLQEGAR